MDKRTVTRVRTPSGAGVVLLVLAAAAWAVSASGACVPSPAGLVGWWPGEGNANDIIGTDNGILQGGATANAAGEVGQAFSFDGTNGYVQIPDSSAFHLATLTVECWVRFDAYQTPGSSAYPYQQYIVFKQNSQSYEFEGFALTKDHDPQGDVILWEVASPTHELIRIDSVNTVVTGAWYHLAGVRGSNYTQLYLNGHLEAQANVNFPQDYGTFPLYFGTSGQSYYDRKLHGELDEVSLYNRALSASEIAAIYAAGSAGKCRPGAPAVVSQLASLLGPPLMPAGRPTLASGPTVPGGFPLVIAGQPRHPCVIEMSDDLVHWSTFTNVTLLPDGTARISAPMTASRQYYRAKLLP